MTTPDRMPEPEYTNGRVRVRPEQIEYLDHLLHVTWVELSRERAQVKEKQLERAKARGFGGVNLDASESIYDSEEDGALVTHMNRELRLIKTLQDEVRRTKGDMGLE